MEKHFKDSTPKVMRSCFPHLECHQASNGSVLIRGACRNGGRMWPFMIIQEYVSVSSVMTFFATMLPLDAPNTSEIYTASTNTDVKERLGKSRFSTNKHIRVRLNLSLYVHMQNANTFPFPQINPKSFNISKNNLIRDKM